MKGFYRLLSYEFSTMDRSQSTRDYTGTNSIFEIANLDDYVAALQQKDAVKMGDARILTSFSLDKNRDNASSGIEVLGLEAVGERLALILVDENKLVIRGYESSSGEQLGEAVIEDFIIAGPRRDDVEHQFYEQ